ncbi:MAG: InlB B-repeat-containing protein [Bacilli bacterium]|nr:InlB B-repeat-containing protein [Bacilli bacterium]
MKKKLLFLVPALLGMLLSACNSGGGSTNPPSDESGGGSESTKTQYTITFKDETGSTLESKKWDEGVVPSYSYNKVDTAEWDYTVEGWATSLGGQVITIPAASADATYYAVVSQIKKSYTVIFYNENAEEIKSETLEYGAQPVCDYVGPSDNAEWDYTFQGWATSQNGTPLESLPIVTESATYYAQINKVKQQYTITFESNGGSSVTPITKDYGTEITEPTKPTKDGYKFVCWTTDSEGTKAFSWPHTLVDDVKLYAQWNEKVNIKTYFQTLLQVVGHDPYSYIPDTMQPENSDNHVTASQVNYDFNNFTNVSNIKYGGHGEQWHMVLENIQESERFYSVLSLGEAAINASVVLFNNYLDNNPEDTASHSLNETTYTAKLDFHNDLLAYTIQYKTNLNIPFFGEVMPQIDMTYNIKTLEKSVRVQLTENNAMKYVVTDDMYEFAIEYGVETVSRKAYFQISRDKDENVAGHIYEFVQYKDKDLVPACADFYITDEYTSVVGNKASGLVGFKGYINELYETEQGKLLGYEVRETLTILGVSGQYNTLWFNLNSISGITNVKAVENENNTGTYTNKNPHDVYLNNSTSVFEPTYNKKLGVNTSRKYDVELRKQYFYGYNEGQFTTYETKIPMMFIQANNDKDTNFSDFPADILSKSGISASVNLATKYLNKIQSDYATLIDLFIEHKDTITSDYIDSYIGDAIVIA